MKQTFSDLLIRGAAASFFLAGLAAQAAEPQAGMAAIELPRPVRLPIETRPFVEAPTTSATKSTVGELNSNPILEAGPKSWTVQFSDGTVRRMLLRWANEAGYQLLWDIPRDFPIEVEFQMEGRFRDVLGTVVKSLEITDYPIQATVNHEIRLVRVIRRLNSQAR